MWDTQINFRVEPEQHRRLIELARATRRTQSDVLRTLIEVATPAQLTPRPIHIEQSANRERA